MCLYDVFSLILTGHILPIKYKVLGVILRKQATTLCHFFGDEQAPYLNKTFYNVAYT